MMYENAIMISIIVHWNVVLMVILFHDFWILHYIKHVLNDRLSYCPLNKPQVKAL